MDYYPLPGDVLDAIPVEPEYYDEDYYDDYDEDYNEEW